MFSQIVSTLLIAAVTACPLWCGSGVLHCCAGEQPAESAAMLENSACGGCCHDVRTESHREGAPADAPADPANPTACQGICGGAVVEKPYQLSDGYEPLFVLTTASEGIRIERPATDVSHVLPPACQESGNAGRTLRTLHMSLVC